MSEDKVEKLKSEGNKFFSKKDYQSAISKFTEAIELDSHNHVLYSNRSAAYCGSKDYERALEDANKVIEINPHWSKGYGRKGAALHCMKRYEDAVGAYESGLNLDKDNEQLKSGLSSAKAALESETSEPFSFDKMNPFYNQDSIGRIYDNPEIQKLLLQPDFKYILDSICKNPSLLNNYISDPRVIQAVLAGMNIGDFGKEMSSPPYEEPREKKEEDPPKEEPKVKVSPEDELKRRESDKMKDIGNQKYKERSFEEALEYYDKALEIDEKNIIVLNNKAAVYFEQNEYEKCIKQCEEALEASREARGDYKMNAKIYSRMGMAYRKMCDYENAIDCCKKSLIEHKTPKVIKNLRDWEREKEKVKEEAYYNPEVSEEERNKGNELFKKGEFAKAIEHYSEAIKRDKKDPRNYSNRAICYSKMAAFGEAVQDCDKAISLDPSFIKPYLRKSRILFLQKEYSLCLKVCQEARKNDKEGKHHRELDEQIAKCYHEISEETKGMSQEQIMKRAMKDPELSQILTDPAMQQILKQMQSDPRAIVEHMKNPVVAENIQKLMVAGVIKVA